MPAFGVISCGTSSEFGSLQFASNPGGAGEEPPIAEQGMEPEPSEPLDSSRKHRRDAEIAEEPSKRHKHHSKHRKDRENDNTEEEEPAHKHHHRHHKHKHRSHHKRHRKETETETETENIVVSGRGEEARVVLADGNIAAAAGWKMDHGRNEAETDTVQDAETEKIRDGDEGTRFARVSGSLSGWRKESVKDKPEEGFTGAEEKEEGEILEDEDADDDYKLIKAADSEIESGEIQPDDVSVKVMDEVSSVKGVGDQSFAGFKVPSVKTFSGSDDRKQEPNERQEAKHDFTEFSKTLDGKDENVSKGSLEDSEAKKAPVEKKKGSHSKIQNEETADIRAKVDKYKGVSNEKKSKYDEIDTRSDRLDVNKVDQVVQYGSSSTYQLSRQETKEKLMDDGNSHSNAHQSYSRERKSVMVEEGSRHSRERKDSVLEDGVRHMSHFSYSRERKENVSEDGDRNRRQGRSASQDSGKVQDHGSRHPRSHSRDNICSRRGNSRSPLKETERERHCRRMHSQSNDGTRDLKIHGRSQSPRNRTKLELKISGVEDDARGKHANSQYDEHVKERSSEKRRSRSQDINRIQPSDRKRSRSPENARDKHWGKGQSPSRESYRDRLYGRKRSRSRETARERLHSRESLRDRTRFQEDRRRSKSRERDMKYRREIHAQNERARHSDSRDASRGVRNDDHGAGRYGRHHTYGRQRELERDRPRDRDSRKDSNLRDRESIQAEKQDKEQIREEENQEEYQERVALQLAEQEEDDIERIKEESRKRRQAILEKYKQKKQVAQLNGQVIQDAIKDGDTSSAENMIQNNSVIAQSGIVPTEQVSGAVDSGQDGCDDFVPDPTFSLGKVPLQNGLLPPAERTSGTGGLGEGSPKGERSADMFCDDIFGESPARVRRLGKGDGLPVDTSGLHDNWDDAEGYYSYRIGEVLDGRYEVVAAHGKGVFSSVVRAKDLKSGKGDPEEVAIKIIRNNETMYKAGQEELIILKKLAGADPEDKRHCVRFLSSFKYRNHLCLVFESLHMNLREVLKKFGRNIGLKLTAVRAYAKQLFIALKHLKNCGVLHCDIKPDNMLVNEAKNVLKLCDFGNAMFAGKNEITPYLVSRFYRAPEIILGLPYDHAMDIWSVGCCLYELYLGKVLFPGPSNNDMLRLHMELKGSFPKKMLRKGGFTDQHFDQDLNFHATEEDPVTKKTVKRLLVNIKPKDIGSLISSSAGEEDPKMLSNFKDLLERIFILDPDKRLTVSQALSHPFITGK